jgi:lipopolysaccharide biosynthesis regulator YciM
MDPDCARVHLLQARIELDTGNPKGALKELHRVCELEPQLLGITLDLFAESCAQLGDDSAYLQILRDGLEARAGAEVVDRFAQHLLATRGADTSLDFRLQALGRQPDLDSFIALLGELQTQRRELDAQAIAPLLKFVRTLRAQRAAYRCRQCGYGSSTLMWQCPSCRAWGQIKPQAPAAVG